MKEMEDKIHLKLMSDAYIRTCYIIPDYVDMRKTKDKNAYTNYFNSLICLSEAMSENYIDDFFIHDIRNEFYTHQIKVSDNGEIGSLLLMDLYDIIDKLTGRLLENEYYEAVVNINKILGK